MSTQHIMQLEPAGTRAEMRDFVSRAVHDLREPLRAIRSASELLAATRSEPSGEVETRCLGLIQSGIDRMETLVRDIAEYCYGEAQELELMETDLTEVVKDAERQLSESLREYSAVITHDDLPAVDGDCIALAAVFRHLIENACKFRGDQPPHIHIGARRGSNEWIVFVRDNGSGFDARYKDLIFKPFEQLEGKRYPGSGLGLTYSKRIVERHSGRIWAESRPGEGTTIWFTLPSGGAGR